MVWILNYILLRVQPLTGQKPSKIYLRGLPALFYVFSRTFSLVKTLTFVDELRKIFP